MLPLVNELKWHGVKEISASEIISGVIIVSISVNY